MKLFTTLFLSAVAASSVLSAGTINSNQSFNAGSVLSYGSGSHVEKANLDVAQNIDCQPTNTVTSFTVKSNPDCWPICPPTKCDPTSATPEPASMFLLGGGLLAAGFLRKRKVVNS